MSDDFDYRPVASSHLTHVGYDAATQRLGIRFKSGGCCIYADVPPEAHEALIGASSPGQHFHANIASTYKWTPG